MRIKILGRVARFLPFLFFSGLQLASCRQTVVDSHREDAIDLYKKSRKMMKLYIDSFSNASDSATLLELEERFTHDLTALNFKYPSETCLEISEGENDTLTNLTERIVFLRDSLLYAYAHPKEDADSIPLDSIN